MGAANSPPDASTPPDAGLSPGQPVDWVAALAERRRWLRTVLLARLSDRQAVDEVLQEVALAALRHGPARLPSGEVSAWLYRVAVRQALLQRRQSARSERRLLEYARRAETLQVNGAGDPLRWLLADEEAVLVRAGLLRLSRADRELLLLKYTEDWSCKDLAAHLGIRVSTVETRLLRARARLRRELATSDERPPRDRHAARDKLSSPDGLSQDTYPSKDDGVGHE